MCHQEEKPNDKLIFISFSWWVLSYTNIFGEIFHHNLAVALKYLDTAKNITGVNCMCQLNANTAFNPFWKSAL